MAPITIKDKDNNVWFDLDKVSCVKEFEAYSYRGVYAESGEPVRLKVFFIGDRDPLTLEKWTIEKWNELIKPNS